VMQENGNAEGDFYDAIYCIGPLNLNRQTKQASTVFKAELSLDGKEFDALDILAAREGEFLTFEQLYNAVWDEKDGSDRRDAARLGINNILSQINEAGDGFMWIGYEPDRGYVFKTRWGHNKNEWKSPEATVFLKDAKKSHKMRQGQYIRWIAAILAAVFIMAAISIANLIINRGNESGYEPEFIYMEIEDEMIPLGEPD